MLLSRTDDVDVLSLAWEAATGADSVRTIERVYPRSAGGAFQCVVPGCCFARKDPEAMWRHVHSAHGRNDLPHTGFDYGAWLL